MAKSSKITYVVIGIAILLVIGGFIFAKKKGNGLLPSTGSGHLTDVNPSCGCMSKRPI